MARRRRPAGPRQPARGRRPARRVRRVVLVAAILFGAIVVVPFLLVPLYRVVPPVSTLMAAAWLRGGPVERDWVGLGEIAPVLVHSVLVSEDSFFCSHRGVDWSALRLALEEAGPEGGRGASTIAMQTARNLFLWQSRSYIRKALELPLAAYADFVLGKRRLMEIYLNVAEWGPGVFGVEAAARHHFGVPAAKLDAHQAALLAVTLPNPILRDPARPSRQLRALARAIERRAAAAGPYVKCIDAD